MDELDDKASQSEVIIAMAKNLACSYSALHVLLRAQTALGNVVVVWLAALTAWVVLREVGWAPWG